VGSDAGSRWRRSTRRYARINAESAAATDGHSAYVYVIDPQFRLRLSFPFGVNAEDMTKDMIYLMRNKES
jgi:hypothetical protein